MKRYLILTAAAILAVALIGCAQPTTPDAAPPAEAPSAEAPTAGEAPVAQVVWTDTIETKDYQSWKPAPGYDTMKPAKGPHGKQVQVFGNPPVTETLGGSTVAEWPVGSKIVKDAYGTDGTTLEGIEYMEKTDEGWYFAGFGPDGTVAAEGVEVEPCQACHAKGPDSVMSIKLP